MPRLKFEQPILQLEKRKGGYFYLKIDASTVDLYEKKRAVRLKCILDEKVEYSCGLNHLGDGNFYIIVATKVLKSLSKHLGDTVAFEIFEDPNPLGVEVPEVLEVLLDQDDEAKAIYDKLTDGKKRSLIYTIKSVRDLDKQVNKALNFLNEEEMKMRRKGK